ncbi:hypothetical protein SFRURICE_015357 [Spodoptera frugiperda]|nr:hypothetical protein SFRURICE_015357 [Spodoptera frugiperda]
MLEAHIHEQHSATHDAAIVALLQSSEFLVKTVRAEGRGGPRAEEQAAMSEPPRLRLSGEAGQQAAVVSESRLRRLARVGPPEPHSAGAVTETMLACMLFACCMLACMLHVCLHAACLLACCMLACMLHACLFACLLACCMRHACMLA